MLESALTSSHCVTAIVTSSSSFLFLSALRHLDRFSFLFFCPCVSLSNVFEMLVALEGLRLYLPSREKSITDIISFTILPSLQRTIVVLLVGLDSLCVCSLLWRR